MAVVGQKDLYNQFITQYENNTFPQCIILAGNDDKQKVEFLHKLARRLDCVWIDVQRTIVGVRSMIDLANKTQSTKLFFVVSEADGLSVTAKNALLKVLEEPPKNCYIALNVVNKSKILPTILSRCAYYTFTPYSKQELSDYISSTYPDLTDKEKEMVLLGCECPTEIDTLYNQTGTITEFFDYVELVVHNIATVPASNSFKIAKSIAFKEEEDKYSLYLFWKFFIAILFYESKYNADMEEYNNMLSAIYCTSQYINRISNPALNKQSLFDMWVIDVRKELNNYGEY